MTTAPATERHEQRRLLTIGAVCRRLQAEFPDISISKIRYLEDQGLLAPRRTQSGYRLFGEDDVERLETILRLQRDEFLPLRVIRQELSSPASKERKRRRMALAAPEPQMIACFCCLPCNERAASAITTALSPERTMFTPMILRSAVQNSGSSGDMAAGGRRG